MNRRISNLLLSLFVLCMNLHAQGVNDYVFATETLGTDVLKYSYPAIHNYTFDCSLASYYGYLEVAKENSRIVLEKDQSAIYNTTSPGLLKSVEVHWKTTTPYTTAIGIYGKSSPYLSVEEGNNAPTSDRQGIIKYIDHQTINELYVGTVDLTTPSPYVAIRAEYNNANVREFLFTWQLCHIRNNLTEGQLGTICLSYDVESADLHGLQAFSIAGKISEDNRVKAIVIEEVTTLTAGTPYIFIAQGTGLCLPYSHAYNKATIGTNVNGLYGTLTDYPFCDDDSFSDGDYYIVTKTEIQRAARESGVKAGRAYIKMSAVPEYVPTPSSGRRMMLTTEGVKPLDEVTAQPSTLCTAPSAVNYSLDARLSSFQHSQTIMIVNGKKVIR